MARVVHARLFELSAEQRDAMHARFAELAAGREWRDQVPWLADSRSPGLFEQLYFESVREDADGAALSAATFLRVAGDETDALALVFILRDLSERFGIRVSLSDPDNPILKLRTIELRGGRLPDGTALEAILVSRPIFKRLRGGQRIEMYPPRALGSAFGTVDGSDRERRAWGFLVHGMRDSRPSFFEAEAEAMRIWRGLRFLE